MTNFKSRPFNIGRSRIALALAISLVLHAILVIQTLPAGWNERTQRRSTPAGNSLNSTLRGTLEPPVTEPNLSTLPTVATNRQSPENRVPRAANRPGPSLHGLSSGVAGISETETASKRRSPSQETISPAISAGVTPSSGEDELDADGLRQYRVNLAAETRRFKRYPQLALDHGWSGTAAVRVAIAVAGVPVSVHLQGSSGHELLDAAALEMIDKAARHALLPLKLRGRTFNVVFPVEFNAERE